ncbi:MAG: thiamine-phosphate kinase [Cyanobacteriota bacterium]
MIRRLGAFAPPGQFADDAALLDPFTPGGEVDGARVAADSGANGGALVVNTDVLVEGIHFSEATTGPNDVGWRAAAANLSDLAAMGCTEVVGLTVGLVAPPQTPWQWVEGVYEGLGEALGRHGGVLLGGDCSSGSQRMLAITALGRLPGPQGGDGQGQAAIRRCDGRPGDVLVSTGPHGLSRLGLALLQNDPGLKVFEPDPDLRQRAIAAHRRPQPRLDVVKALVACRPIGMPWRVAGCDSSDGLLAAVAAITAASGESARLEQGDLPLDPAMALVPQARSWCLGGGEDFELVLALEPSWASALISALPTARAFGTLMASPAPGSLSWSDGTPIETAALGFCHFSEPNAD